MRNLLAFPDESRVWIYQADQPFEDKDIVEINQDIEDFCKQWTSHNRDLKAIGGVMHDWFVVLVVDETASPASGCSIDKSVAFIKYLEQKYGRRLLDRQQIAWLDEESRIHTVSVQDIKEAVKNGKLSPETRIFDNLVATRQDYIKRWVVPLKDSWVRRFA